MSRILLSAAALALVAFSLPNLANAQVRGSLHGNLAGGAQHVAPFGGNKNPRLRQGAFPFYGFNTANTYYSFHRPTNLPYFAQHPPVYYSRDIVKRPYGVSPYAAAAGVIPSEFHLHTQGGNSLHIVNPYVEPADSGSNLILPSDGIIITPPVAPDTEGSEGQPTPADPATNTDT